MTNSVHALPYHQTQEDVFCVIMGKISGVQWPYDVRDGQGRVGGVSRRVGGEDCRRLLHIGH